MDDNKLNQQIVQRMLEKVPLVIQNKVELIIADNGEDAYQKFLVYNIECSASSGNIIKLVLMDCEMPVLDGYEAS